MTACPNFDGTAVIDKEATGGMSLRDWFAGQVLSGIITAGTPNKPGDIAAQYAEAAYLMADAMLAARQAPAAVPTPQGDV